MHQTAILRMHRLQERAYINLFISTEWVIVRNNTTIWPRPIRDLTTLLSHPPVIPLRSRRAALPPPPFHFLRFPDVRIDLTETRAAIPRAVHAYVRACGRACLRARTHTQARTWRSDDACTCRVVHFENPTRSYLPCSRHDSREENL